MITQHTNYLVKNVEFNFDELVHQTGPELQDIILRTEIIQDVIDRMVDRNFSKEYKEDLDKLNKKYPVEYQLVKGVRIYKRMGC